MSGPTNMWSADGWENWSADGYPGWSADGYEPNPLAFAVSFITNGGDLVGSITPQYSALVPYGWVITGYPGIMTEQPLNTSINLLISAGAAPVPPVPVPIVPPTTLVPNVVGKFYIDAQLAILNAGLLIALPSWALSSTSSPQFVISQSLAAGSRVNQQTQMTIVVSGFPVQNQGVGTVPVP
jgi:beta-lactam-binding protein with PASTA domain